MSDDLDLLNDIKKAMAAVESQTYRVQHWPHHPKCLEPLGGDHIRCPIHKDEPA